MAAAAAAGASPASPGAPGSETERGSGPSASSPESPATERGAELGTDEEQPVPYPALAATVFFCLGQTTRPRSWCLRLVCNPYPSRAAGEVASLVWSSNCPGLGLGGGAEGHRRGSQASLPQAFDDFIFAFFAAEMLIKMVALGLFGQKCYLGDTWNRLDFFIVMAGMMEYSLDGHNVSLSAIRTVRVLRPLRAINRVPTHLLQVLLPRAHPSCRGRALVVFYVLFLRPCFCACVRLLRPRNSNLSFLRPYYQPEEGEENPFICSSRRDNGMRKCSHIPSRRELRVECTLGWEAYGQPQAEGEDGAGRHACINWNQYYNVCRSGDSNPHNGAVSFDNIGYAWIAIFQVITLEGWVDIMYYVMDAHSFYNFIYFILLIIVGSFFMINLCLVVIATQFSETKQRENQLMREQRSRYLSNDSTLASFSEPGSCYEELLRYVGHVCRKLKRRSLRLYARWQSRWHKKVDPSASLHGQGPGRRVRRAGGRAASIHHLVYHHHHHHHHHYHFSHSSPRRPGPEPGARDTRLLRAGVPPSPGHAPPDTESVHSVYHADCHVEGPQERARAVHAAATAAASLKLATSLGAMNYPTILPSAAGDSRGGPGLKGKRAGGPAGAGGHSPLSSPDPCEKIQHLVGEHGLGQAPSRLSGLSVPCPLPSPQAGTLTCELSSCPYCTSALEDPELEFSGSDSGDSDSNGVYEFTQDVRHGDRRDPMRSPPVADAPGPGSARRRAQRRAAGERAGPGRVWASLSSKLRHIVDSKYFNRGIMVAILTNTLSMGVEYHEQPDELTNALEISNIVFTSMFALEMLLKLLACGPLGYIRNPYNIFDGIIVVISVWEIIGQADGGLSVLRTFRLLRVLKLVRFMPALRRQLVVLMKTMDNVATFCMLLMLFIFIFSILGMHLFGCKFSLKTDTGDTVPDRKNFDSLLWAIVTVFQILTQEDWNVVLYNGMASTSSWAALYFVALMTFGNYVLFNLLVAILVEGFQAEGDATRSDTDEDKMSTHLEEDLDTFRDLRATELKMFSLAVTPNGHLQGRGSLPPPLIMRTAATPMPTPKSFPHLDATPGLLDSRRGSSSSVDPQLGDQKSLSSLRSSPCAHWGPNSAWSSRRSSWNSLGRAPSLKRRSQCGERESLLSCEGKGGGSTDEEAEDGRPRPGASPTTRATPLRRTESLDHRSTLDLRPPRPATLLPTKLHDCNGQVLALPSEFFLRVDSHKEDPAEFDDDVEDSCCSRLQKVLEPYKPECCRSREPWALYLFSPQNRFRGSCQKIIAHKMFDHVVLVFIFLNCITIALERPDIDPSSTERLFLSVSNYIFTAIFVAEMTVKVVALGLVSGEHAYLQSSWNVLDGLLVLVPVGGGVCAALAPRSGGCPLGPAQHRSSLCHLSRVISRAPGLKLVVETLISSLRPIGNIVLICCAFFIIFGILGVQLFKGKFYYCEGADTRNISTKAECRAAHYRWVRRKYNFDNLGQALMSLFVLSSKDGWVNIMYDGLDAVGIDQQVRWVAGSPGPPSELFFLGPLLISGNLSPVHVGPEHGCRRGRAREGTRRAGTHKPLLPHRSPLPTEAQRRPYYADYSPTRRSIHSLCTSHYLDLFITFIIGVNVITMSMEHYNQPKSLDEALKYCNYVFTIVFIVEAALKLVAFGFRRFFKDRWNQLDLAIVLLSIMGITLEEIEMNAALPINPTIIRIMRVLRIARVLKLLKMATGMRALLDTVVQALPQVGNLGLLFMLLFFIYAALGVELFGRLECSEDNPCEGLSRHATFSNFGMAFLTLFRVSTGDNWNGIMKDTLRECAREDKHCLSYLPAISPIYFVTFVLVAQFVLVNVVVAVLMKHLEESNKEAREDAELDAELELELAQRPPARPSPAAPQSPGAGPDPSNLLVVRKVSVSRMLSLPNDSYMFRPVAPAAAAHPHPPQDVEMESYAGLVTSIHSPPAESCTSLQVPSAASSPARGAGHSPSLSRLLCRQEALATQSLEGQVGSPGDSSPSWGEPGRKTPGRQATLGASVCSPPRSPRPASVRIRKHTFGQHCISSRPPAPGREEAEAPDPADEEVSHITSSARGPVASPAACEPDLHRLYSVDAQGFLDQPGQADEQRRPSVEQGCGDGLPEAGVVKARAPEAELALGARRKKKMSPPCISVEPPAEDEGTARPPVAEGSSTTLRRRTPSCEAAPHRDPLEPLDSAGLDAAAKGERRGQAPCRTDHLTIPSFAFEPLDMGAPGGDPLSDGSHGVTPEPRPCPGAMVPPEPQQMEPSVLSGDPPEEGERLHLTVPQSPLKKGPPPAPAPGDGVDKPV
uniref:Ion transport domain-containing protein n=1 Tax=Sus scrofa TaxID=9823 RepID=A0A8D0PBI8_PIG